MGANGLYMAINRQINLEQKLNYLAYDLANSSSAGHKGKELVETVNATKVGFNKYLEFANNSGYIRDSYQGRFQPTGDPLNVAIMGKGHFSVQTPTGTAYTRDGIFTRNSEGNLITAAGHLVLDEGGAPLTLPAGQGPIQVSANGTITCGKINAGQIGVTQFENDNLMQDIGDNLYITDQDPQTGEKYVIESGGYEASTVDPIKATTGLLEILRQYEQLEKYNNTIFKQMQMATENLIMIPPTA